MLAVVGVMMLDADWAATVSSPKDPMLAMANLTTWLKAFPVATRELAMVCRRGVLLFARGRALRQVLRRALRRECLWRRFALGAWGACLRKERLDEGSSPELGG